MNTSYTILSTIIIVLLLFLYLSWLYVSAKYVWIKDTDNSVLKKKSTAMEKHCGFKK